MLCNSPVLKTSGSAFENFIKDEYTTLVPVNDRIFSTSVDLSYTFSPVHLSAPKDEKKHDFAVPEGADLVGGAWDGEGVAEKARKITLEVFATDESASVQVCTSLKIHSSRLIHLARLGNTLQDGPESHRRKRPHCLRHIYIAQQTLYRS
jgi:urate oxidase